MSQASSDNNITRDRAATAAAQVLQSEGGKVLLEYLRQQTECRSNMPADAKDGQQTALFMAFQEGEKNLYREINQLIKKGRGNE